jgi:hypothetical protein
MMRIITTLFLLLILVLGVQAQNQGRWASAHERGLKGAVHIVVSSCSDIKGNYETRYKYEYARDGELKVITSPQIKLPDCIISTPMSHKITKRNSSWDVEEVSYFLEGDLLEKERYEYEYDSVGNWVKAVTYLMRTYEMEGGNWKEGEWQARYVCTRTIEYYP